MWNTQTAHTFWARVDKSSDCWLWTGAVNSSGYGSVAWGGKVYTAHRVAAWLEGMVGHPSAPPRSAATHVLHRCDNRRCCNPAHLFLGTYGDNNQDAYNKRRKVQPRGAEHANAKLTAAQADEIRQQFAAGATKTSLALAYNVTFNVVHKIVQGRSYVG